MENQKDIIQLPQVIQEILVRRGVDNLAAQKDFLFPNLASLPSPEFMLNLEAAADLAIEYALKDRKIIIWGDYDVDGTTGTALLILFFRLLGLECIWHIPNRLQEGYGLNIDWFLANKTKFGSEFLLITVDCGSGDTAVIKQIQSIGGEVIVTDHHLIPKNFTAKCIVVNPSQAECGFHNYCLAGVGVAFYFAAAVRKNLHKNKLFKDIYKQINLKKLLPFVALGTLSDMVPITHVNRILVRAGMEAISACQIPGLNTLLEFCNIKPSELTSEDVGFLLGPKINAAGRLGESSLVVELFIEEDIAKTRKLTKILIGMNRERKAITDHSLEIALTKLNNIQVQEDKCVAVVANVHRGVAGIVASRLVDYYKVPALILCDNGVEKSSEALVGSARSIEGVHIIDIIKKSSRYLEKFGGHAMAAGLTVRQINCGNFLKELKRNLKLAVSETAQERQINPFDVECTIDTLFQDDVIDIYKLLEPFGPGNPQPVFQSSHSIVIDSKTVGNNGSHLSVTFRTKFSKIKGIGFNLGDRLAEVQSQPDRKIIFTPTINRFRGRTSWQLRLIHI